MPFDTTFFDPELLFVECERCGAPLLWQPGETTALLEGAGVDVSELDAACMIMSDGCHACSPDQGSFVTKIVRLQAAA